MDVTVVMDEEGCKLLAELIWLQKQRWEQRPSPLIGISTRIRLMMALAAFDKALGRQSIEDIHALTDPPSQKLNQQRATDSSSSTKPEKSPSLFGAPMISHPLMQAAQAIRTNLMQGQLEVAARKAKNDELVEVFKMLSAGAAPRQRPAPAPNWRARLLRWALSLR